MVGERTPVHVACLLVHLIFLYSLEKKNAGYIYAENAAVTEAHADMPKLVLN